MTPPRLRVADFPRPPAIEPVSLPIRIVFGGEEVASCKSAWRILETTHPPTYYLPIACFRPGALSPTDRRSVCEWKGAARYFSVTGGGGLVAADAAWGYPDPAPAYAALRGHVAVYAWAMDACYIGNEQVRAQPGGFYGGWVTDDLIGPFKGAPGTEWW